MNEVEIVTKFENHELRIKRTEERMNQIEQVQQQIQDLAFSVHDLATSINQMVEEQKTISQRVEAIEKEPADKWRNLTKTAIAVLVSAVVTYFLTKAGM